MYIRIKLQNKVLRPPKGYTFFCDWCYSELKNVTSKLCPYCQDDHEYWPPMIRRGSYLMDIKPYKGDNLRVNN